MEIKSLVLAALSGPMQGNPYVLAARILVVAVFALLIALVIWLA